jgi:hypothetical protein
LNKLFLNNVNNTEQDCIYGKFILKSSSHFQPLIGQSAENSAEDFAGCFNFYATTFVCVLPSKLLPVGNTDCSVTFRDIQIGEEKSSLIGYGAPPVLCIDQTNHKKCLIAARNKIYYK